MNFDDFKVNDINIFIKNDVKILIKICCECFIDTFKST